MIFPDFCGHSRFSPMEQKKLKKNKAVGQKRRTAGAPLIKRTLPGLSPAGFFFLSGFVAN